MAREELLITLFGEVLEISAKTPTIVGIQAEGPRAAHTVFFQVASLPPERDYAWLCAQRA